MKDQNQFRLSWWLQPVMIALFPALHICSMNPVTSFLHVFFTISIITVTTTLLFLLASLIYKNFAKGALATNLLVISCYGIKILVAPTYSLFTNNYVLSRYIRASIFILSFIAIMYVLYKIFKRPFRSFFLLKVAILPFILINGLSIHAFITKKIKLTCFKIKAYANS